jgi:hypothetical protein
MPSPNGMTVRTFRQVQNHGEYRGKLGIAQSGSHSFANSLPNRSVLNQLPGIARLLDKLEPPVRLCKLRTPFHRSFRHFAIPNTLEDFVEAIRDKTQVCGIALFCHALMEAERTCLA